MAIQQKYNIPRFELSQAYLFFWDKVEKANYFLESILDTVDGEDVDGRLVSALNASPVGDGGQWVCIMHLWRFIIGFFFLFLFLFFSLFFFSSRFFNNNNKKLYDYYLLIDDDACVSRI